MREEKYHLMLDEYEHGIMINALNELRNKMLEQDRPVDAVNEMILKLANAPRKKGWITERYCDEER